MNEPARSDTTGAIGSTQHRHRVATKKELAWVSLGALGVVYGDIGTSPLYAMRECFNADKNPHHANAANLESVFGVLSLVFWSLTIVVVFKYLWIVLRADN